MLRHRLAPHFGSRWAAASIALLAVGGLAACETAQGPYAYSPYEAGRVSRVDEGVVVGGRPVTFGGSERGSGALIGGAAGAAIGSQFGGDTGGRIAGAIIGGVGGAAAGQAIQQGRTRQGFAYTIRRSDGTTIEVAQEDAYAIPPNTRVQIIYGDRVRVVPAPY